MSLDLGALVAHATIEDVSFQRSYVRLVRQFADLGAKATTTAAGTNRLDESLAQAAAAGNAAAAGLGHADKAMAEAGVSASTAAAATGALKASTTDAGLSASRLAQAQLRQAAAQERLTVLQESGKASARQLALANASLLAANDRVALSEERLGRATGLTGQTWQNVGHGMLISGGLIAAGFAIAGKEAISFDAKMALVHALLTTNGTPAAMKQLHDAALTVGQAYGYTAGQVADAEAELVKAGISVRDIMGGALTGALTLAAAGQEDVASATNTAAVAMTQFGLSGKDVPHIADLLAAGADKALGSVGDLSEALKYGGLAASQAGMSIEQTVGILAELAQSGQIGSTAGSQLAMMLRNLEKPTTQAQAVMKQYGISVYDATGQMLPMSAIAGELHDKIGSLAPANRDAALATLFTSRAVRAANVLMRGGAEDVQAWTAKVDASGFAALQAAGKLDSLSGDATKLKSALQEALIGTGESAQGPLRSATQDVTALVTTWNGLPGPVKSGAEALMAVAGASLIVGGAMIVLLPKIAATKLAMEELGISGSKVGAVLGKGGILVAAITASVMAVGAIDNAMHHTSINADAMGASLENLARTGRVTGEITRAFGSDLSNLKDTVNLSSPGVDVLGLRFHNLGDTFTHAGGDFKDARDRISSVDQALTDMVTSGHADQAATAWETLAQAAKDQGVSVKTLASRFPQYSGALRASAQSAIAAGNGVDKYGNAVTRAAKQTQSAADAAKHYNDALHALADPLFAMNQALGDLRTKQTAVNQAIQKYGAHSRQARQAQLDMASSALDVAAASKTLTASVDDGTTSLGAAKAQLRGWVDAGLITQKQANAVALSFGGLIDKANHVAGSLKNAAAGTKAAGEAIGHDFAAGVAIGIDNNSVTAEMAAIHMAQKAAAAARSVKGFNSHSPSRVGHDIGMEFGVGTAEGIDASTAHVVAATNKMTTAATLAADQALQAHLANQIQAVSSQLSTIRGNAASLSSGVASSLTGAFDIANAPNVSVKGLTSFLAYGAKSTATFDKLEHRLIGRHLDPALVQQLVAMEANNPGEGIAAARNILAGGPGAIRRLDRLENQIQRSATRTGQAISKQQFGGEMHRLATKLDTLHRDLHDLNQTVHGLVHEAKLQQHKATVRTHR